MTKKKDPPAAESVSQPSDPSSVAAASTSRGENTPSATAADHAAVDDNAVVGPATVADAPASDSSGDSGAASEDSANDDSASEDSASEDSANEDSASEDSANGDAVDEDQAEDLNPTEQLLEIAVSSEPLSPEASSEESEVADILAAVASDESQAAESRDLRAGGESASADDEAEPKFDENGEPVDQKSALAEFWGYESLDEELAGDRAQGAQGADFRLTPKERRLAGMRLESKVEAVVFAAQKPLKPQEILEILQEKELKADDIQTTLDKLVQFYEERAGGFRLHYLKRLGYQFQTAEAAGPIMERMFASRPRPISRAALETLSIIAYRQPVTRAEVEFIRGVDAGSIFKTLLERELIRCVGRKEIVGRPMLFGTTDQFLTVFNLSSIKDLPSLESFQPNREMVQGAMARLGENDEIVDVEEYIADATRGEGAAEDAGKEPEDLVDEAEIEALATASAQPEDTATTHSADQAPPADRPHGATANDLETGVDIDGSAQDSEVAQPDGRGLPEGSGELDH